MYDNQPLLVETLEHARDFRITEKGFDENEGPVPVTREATPIYDHEGDSGLRLYVLEDVVLYPFQKVKIPHGIAVQPLPGYETQIRPRSSSFPNKDLLVVFGTIDQPYGGEISSVVMYMPPPTPLEIVDADGVKRTILTFSPEPISLKKGDRISQLVVAPVVFADVIPVARLPVASRGNQGWGSTGG